VDSATPVDRAPMADSVNSHQTRRIIDPIKDPVISGPDAIAVFSDEFPASRRPRIRLQVVDDIGNKVPDAVGKIPVFASRPSLDLDSVSHFLPPRRGSFLTSSQAWKPVASLMASRRSAASSKSSIFSLKAISRTKFFRRPSLLQTRSSWAVRSAGSLVANGAVFIPAPFMTNHDESYHIYSAGAADSKVHLFLPGISSRVKTVWLFCPGDRTRDAG